MTSLYEYIIESMILEAGGFVNLLDNKQIGKFISSQYNLSDSEGNAIQNEFDRLFNIAAKNNIPARALYDTSGKKYVKIPYSLINIILDNVSDNSGDDFYHKVNPSNEKKVYIYYKGKKIAETGSGNYGSKSLDKEIHENLTAIYYNTDEKYWDILDDKVSSLYNYANLDVWIPSFHEQVKAIKDKYNNKSFRAVRIDNKSNIAAVYTEVLNGIKLNWDGKLSNSDKIINNSYNKISDMQKTWLVKSNGATRLRREAYDKSDIVLYNESKISQIKELADSLNSLEDAVDIKSEVVKLFNDEVLIGVSLKGLSNPNGSFEMVEFNTEQSIKNGVVKDLKKYSVSNILRQKKNSYNIQNGFSIDITTDDNKKLMLILRSFGSNAALEVKFASKPPLGKSPVFLWRKFVEDNKKNNFLNNANSKNIKDLFTGNEYNILAERFGWDTIPDDTVFNFESTNISTIIGLQFLFSLCNLNDNEILENLSTWTKAAIAEADYAFPFILTEEI